MKVGILGSTDVAKSLARGFLQEGHEVMLSSRDPEKIAAWVRESGKGASREIGVNSQSVAKLLNRRMPFAVTVLALTLLTAAMVGCGHVNALNPEGKPPLSEKVHNMKININIVGKTLTATLEDNETARDFASLLPLHLSMNDLFSREKYANLPKRLSEKGPRKKDYAVGDIAYWSPSHDLAIYYHRGGESIPSPGIIPIAKIDSSAEAFKLPGSVTVAIQIAK